MRRVLAIGLLLALLLLLFAAAWWAMINHYDRARYNQIDELIAADGDHLLGRSLAEVSGLLGLEDVPWDLGYTNSPDCEMRIYHFRGFALYIHLQILPPGVTPNTVNNYSLSETDLRRSGVRWVWGFYPFLKTDGIADRKARMAQYWVEVGHGLAEKGRKEAKKLP